jgi:hypothetical protein
MTWTSKGVCPRCGAAVYDEYVHSHWCQAQHMSPWPQRERYEGTDDWDA